MNDSGAPERSLSLEDWALILQERFFPLSRSKRIAYLAVDDEVLDELAGGLGSGATGLVRAVRPQLRLHDERHLFDDIAALGFSWNGRGFIGPPPMLPFLALCVLAASRMDASRGFSAQNYYQRLREVLDVASSPQAAYRDTVPAMFRVLHEWLQSHVGRSRGISTIPSVAQPAHIGFALTQALMRESDRRKLTRFFVALGLKPSDAGNSTALLAPLRSWASRSDLSAGAKRLISDEQFRAQAISMLAGELEAWDQTERDAQGRRVARIRLLLGVAPRLTWGLMADRPVDFPPRATFTTSGGLELVVQSSLVGSYDPEMFGPSLPAIVAAALTTPQSLQSGEFAMRLALDSVTPLGPDPDTGFLVSRSRISPGHRHWLLVADHLRMKVEGLLNEVAREGWVLHPAALPGWRLYRDVFVDLPPVHPVDPELAALVPAVDARPDLRGGLQIAGEGGTRRYLVGGEPDLWIPGWLSTQPGFAVYLDDSPIDPVTPGSTRYQLSGREVPEGQHRLRAGWTTVSFLTVSHVIERSPWDVGACTIVLRPPALTATTADGSYSGPSVCGAIVTSATGTARDLHPVLLPFGGSRYVLIGREVGKVAAFSSPPRPSWLETVGLISQDFEVFADFPVAWTRIEWEYSGPEIVPVEAGPPLADNMPEDSDEWVAQMLGPSRCRYSDADERLAQYRALAQSIIRFA